MATIVAGRFARRLPRLAALASSGCTMLDTMCNAARPRATRTEEHTAGKVMATRQTASKGPGCDAWLHTCQTHLSLSVALSCWPADMLLKVAWVRTAIFQSDAAKPLACPAGQIDAHRLCKPFRDNTIAEIPVQPHVKKKTEAVVATSLWLLMSTSTFRKHPEQQSCCIMQSACYAVQLATFLACTELKALELTGKS